MHLGAFGFGELKQVGALIPNPTLLIKTLPLLEAQPSSTILHQCCFCLGPGRSVWLRWHSYWIPATAWFSLHQCVVVPILRSLDRLLFGLAFVMLSVRVHAAF